MPVALAAEPALGAIPGKRGVRVLSDRPINCETPVTLLDDDFTPNHLHFVRNNGQLPPPDAVRLEELVNYFKYKYPQPKGDDPFSVNMEMADCPWQPGPKRRQ